MARKPAQIYQIKVTLDGVRPPVWRRIMAPGNTTLLKLHDILQIVMGWQDYHLHMFTIKGLIFGDPANDEDGDLGILDEADYQLSHVIQRERQRFKYRYDFGDGWDHTLHVERIVTSKEGMRHPLCLTGKRACPPEDVGGVGGYGYFLEAVRDPTHDEHDEYLVWVGGEFDPEAFNLDEVNIKLRQMGRGRSTEALNPWLLEEGGYVERKINRDSEWHQKLPDEQRSITENLPLRLDLLTLLTYLRDNKVTGTSSMGNLPLKAVYEVCAKFVNPPELEKVIGQYVHRVRSETAVWSLFFVHLLSSLGGLVEGGPGRRWKVTPLGERFLEARPPVQVWLMFATWWTQVNWAIASPFSFEDEYIPSGFTTLTLKHLLALPIGDFLPYKLFADGIIEDAGMVWQIPNQDNENRILQGIIERMVINPLREFNILQAVYEPHKTFGHEIQVLTAFRITPFGEGLLKAISEAIQ